MRSGSPALPGYGWDWMFPIGIGLVLGALTIAVWDGQVDSRRALQQQRTLDVSAQAARRLEVFLDSHLRAVEVFARRWAADESRDFSRERFENFSAILKNAYPGLHRLLLQPAAGGPAWAGVGDEALAELMNRPDHRRVLDRARARSGPALSAPFQGPNGENKFFAALPMHRDRELLGYLLVVFRAQTLIDDCFHERIRSEFQFQISDGDHDLYLSHPTATDAQLAASPIQAVEQIPVGDRTWTLSMAPRPELAGAIGWGSDLSVPGLGFGLSAGMAMLAWLLVRRMRQVRAAHAATLAEVAERKRAEDARERALIRLAQLSRQVIRAQEDERGRLSRELHDELGQLLTALRLELGWLEKSLAGSGQQTSDPLTNVTTMVEEATRQLRRLCKGLRPPLLDDLGLEPAVRQLVDEFRTQTGVEVDLALDIPEQVDRIPVPAALCTYRILQEALTNVRRHSRAALVSIAVRSKDSQLLLEVEDDGCGFELDEIKDEYSCGLEGMRERANLVAGELTIASRPGDGCRVSMRVPIEVVGKGV